MIAVHCPHCGSIIHDDFGDAFDSGLDCPTCFAGAGEYHISAEAVRLRFHVLADAVDLREPIFVQKAVMKINDDWRRVGMLSRIVSGKLVRDRQMKLI